MTDVDRTGALTKLDRLLRVFDDWWNPILVKEVRQSLRGKFFRVCFACTLIAVTIASMSLIIGMGGVISAGESWDYFNGIYVCLAIAVLGLVPFSAFNAMGAEWDENTFDLLVISNMRPRQIIWGKLLSAGAQTMLYFSAFSPFIVFSFLLQKIDLLVVFWVLGLTFLISIGLSVVSLMLSTLSRVKFARVVLMAALAAALMFATVGCISLAWEIIRRPGELRDADVARGTAGFVAFVIIVGAFCFLTGCNMLSHPEENRSTGVRVLTTVALVITLGFFAYLLESTIKDREVVSAMALTTLGCLLVPSIFFVTEPEYLGRRVVPRVPRNPMTSLLSAPFLPGGGRGVLLFGIHVAIICFFVLVMQASMPATGGGFLSDGIAAFIAGALYACIYLLLPAGLLAPFTKSPQLRAVIRGLIPLLVVVFGFVPSLLGFFIGDRRLMEGKHAGNPAFIMDSAWNRGSPAFPGIWILLVILFAVALLLNLRRIVYGLTEVADARAHRLKIERRRSGDSAADASGGTDAVARA